MTILILKGSRKCNFKFVEYRTGSNVTGKGQQILHPVEVVIESNDPGFDSFAGFILRCMSS